VAEELRSAGIEDVPVVVAGTDPAPTILDVPELRDGRSIAILCVAHWRPAKGVAELLLACRSLPEGLATVHLVGDTHVSSGFSRVVHRLIRHPSLRQRVIVHGPMEPEAIAPLRAGADVFALPSHEETFGMAWTEALAAGLPVVGWDTSNLPNLVTDGIEGLLVPRGDVVALAAALARLAVDRELRRRLSVGARRRAATLPTWAQTTDRFVGILRERLDQEVL
jgi:glycosyltransferase involved in cell wall biosynthesis